MGHLYKFQSKYFLLNHENLKLRPKVTSHVISVNIQCHTEVFWSLREQRNHSTESVCVVRKIC